MSTSVTAYMTSFALSWKQLCAGEISRSIDLCVRKQRRRGSIPGVEGSSPMQTHVELEILP